METVTVGGVTSQVISYQARPVCTTRQLAEFYACDPDNIKRNFSNNSGRFSEGKHYIRLEGEELRSFKSHMGNDLPHVPDRAARLILWTEKGAARHAKMLSTDRAWDVFEALEEAYFRPAAQDPVQMLNDPETLRSLLLTNTERVIALEKQVSEDAPKVAFHDQVAACDDYIGIREAAQVLGTGRSRLMAKLRALGWIDKWNVPYQRSIDQGVMQSKVGQFDHPEHGLKKSITPMITGKGLARLQKILREEAVAA